MSKENVPSVYSDKVKEAIESIPQELYSLSEEALRYRVKPTLKLYEVKRAFWEELLLAQERGAPMRTWRVYDGKVSKAYFYDKVLTSHEKMAWITSPLDTYEDKSKAALDMISNRYEELINMDIYTTKKRKVDGEWTEYREVCPKLAMVLLQTMKNLEDRVKGTAVSRQVSIHATEPVKKEKQQQTLSEIEKRIIELDKEITGEYTRKNTEERVLREDGSDNQRENSGTETQDAIPTTGKLVNRREK